MTKEIEPQNENQETLSFGLPFRIYENQEMLLFGLPFHIFLWIADADSKIEPHEIDEQLVSRSLYTSGIIDPDLLIRTAGEFRVSNFLLWQLSYAELYVEDVCWPDFTVEHLHKAILTYAHRSRRFGGLDSAC